MKERVKGAALYCNRMEMSASCCMFCASSLEDNLHTISLHATYFLYDFLSSADFLISFSK